MSRNNDVFKVLVAKTALATAGKQLSELAPGQIAIFNADTNLTVDPTKTINEFYFGVGLDDGSGNLGGVERSAGQVIQKNNIRYYQAQPYTASRPEIVEISAFKAKSDTEYSVKLEFRNSKVYNQQGYNQFSKTYTVVTPGEDGVNESIDSNLLVKLLVNTINADTDNLVKAEAINPSNNTVITDIDAFITTNKSVNTDSDTTNDVIAKIRLTTISLSVNNYCNVNLMYFKPRDTTITVSLGLKYIRLTLQ